MANFMTNSNENLEGFFYKSCLILLSHIHQLNANKTKKKKAHQFGGHLHFLRIPYHHLPADAVASFDALFTVGTWFLWLLPWW